MAEISLRAYEQDIQEMIDHGHFDEAVAHCQNILARFPKHVETYRLLGKAYLEQGRHADAADIFQRVLSAIPDDFLSHVAMAIMGEDAGNLDTAIWHMERAFEVNPSNPTVQQEVRRLRGLRDGVEPSRLRMTQASLARMYLKGRLDAQAAAEVNSALKDDPDRPDLLVVLANAYWQMGKLAEGAEVCNRILDKLPFCLEANQILARILWKTGRKEEAQDVFRRLAALDPYVGVRPPTDDGRMPDVPSGAVLVERLSWTPPLQEQRGPPPGWAEGLGLKKQEPGKVEIPEWLEPSKSLPVEASTPFSAEAEESPFHPPDWLGEAAAEIPGASDMTAEQLLGPEEPEAALARMGQELPDWLKPGSASEGAPPAPPKPSDWLTPETPKKEGPSGDFADWLKAVGGEESLTRAGEGLPEWLKPEGGAAQPAEPAEALPDWLKGEAPESGQTTEEYPEIPLEHPSGEEAPLRREGGLDWFPQTGAEPVVSPFDLAAAGKTGASEKLPEWLEAELREAPGITSQEIAPAEQGKDMVHPAEAPPLSGGEPPSWLKGAGVEGSLLSEAAEGPEPVSTGPTGEVAPAVPATELPDWLQAEMAGPASIPGQAPVPDWLRTEISKEGEKTPESSDLAKPKGTAGPVVEPPKEKETELPEWLGTAPAQMAKPASSEQETFTPQGEIPDWLKRIATEASSVAEEATPPEPETGTGELPSWLDSRQPGASDTISKWLGERLGPRPGTEEEAEPAPEAEDLPEWLRPPAEAEAKGDQAAIEEMGPTPEAGPVLPETTPRIEKAGEQAPPDWLRTALGLAESELSSVLPAQESRPAQTPAPEVQLTQAPAEEQKVPATKPKLAPVLPPSTAGPAKETHLPPAVVGKLEPGPAPSPFVPPMNEEPAAAPAERPEWIPVVEPVASPALEPVVPRRQEPLRAPAPKVPPVAKKKPRKLTKEEAALLLPQARKYLEESREVDAAAAYQKLLESARNVEEIADDLEQAVGDFPDASPLWQLLGDANGKLGRLQRAYEAYAKALETI